eukprot:g78060.t1
MLKQETMNQGDNDKVADVDERICSLLPVEQILKRITPHLSDKHCSEENVIMGNSERKLVSACYQRGVNLAAAAARLGDPGSAFALLRMMTMMTDLSEEKQEKTLREAIPLLLSSKPKLRDSLLHTAASQFSIGERLDLIQEAIQDNASFGLRNRLRLFYERHAPQHLNTMQDNLLEYGQSEPELWSVLETKYGPGSTDAFLPATLAVAKAVAAKDDARAVALYQLAAAQGHANAQVKLALRFEKGRGVEKNMTKAVELYQLAAAQGYYMAQTNLGVCYKNGRGVKKNKIKAVELFQLAAAQGHARAQFYLGACYEHGSGVEKNEAKAVELYQLAAAQGHAAAQCQLGVCYKNGHGVEKNEAKAVELYQQAAAKGFAIAQNNLGVCYKKGSGVEKNEVKAVELFQIAAVQGHADAQYNLGVCFEYGHGVEKNEAKAMELYQQAAAQGHADAQYNLDVSLVVESLFGVEKNEAKAVELYQQPVAQGQGNTKSELNFYYETVAREKIAQKQKRKELYQLAAAQGSANLLHSFEKESGHGWLPVVRKEELLKGSSNVPAMAGPSRPSIATSAASEAR